MGGATFHFARHDLTEWRVRKLLERRPFKGKNAHLSASFNCISISISLNGCAFQRPKLLIRSSPHFHMAPLLTTPDILST